ncbi:hypothetical protein [Rhodococcus erythropolis]
MITPVVIDGLRLRWFVPLELLVTTQMPVRRGPISTRMPQLPEWFAVYG